MPAILKVEPRSKAYYLGFDDYSPPQGRARFRFWCRHPLRPVKRFALVLDPACIAACVFYAINRWLIEPHVSAAWDHSWVNDAFLIPAALPVLLTIERLLGLRGHDAPPTWTENLAHLAAWSFLFEYLGPMLNHRSTGDIWDVVAYSVGAIAAGCWWQRRRARGVVPETTATMPGLQRTA
jgi:hypothetical protein